MLTDSWDSLKVMKIVFVFNHNLFKLQVVLIGLAPENHIKVRIYRILIYRYHRISSSIIADDIFFVFFFFFFFFLLLTTNAVYYYRWLRYLWSPNEYTINGIILNAERNAYKINVNMFRRWRAAFLLCRFHFLYDIQTYWVHRCTNNLNRIDVISLIFVLGWNVKLPTSTRIQALNLQSKELIWKQFSSNIMCIVWTKHGTKVNSRR